MIEDARAMLAPNFAEKLNLDIAASGAESAIADANEFAHDDADIRFDFGMTDAEVSVAQDARDRGLPGILPTEFSPFAATPANPTARKLSPHERKSLLETTASTEETAFRKPGDAATLPELIKFLIDRSGYIRVLEDEATPESQSRIENLRELVNAAQDAHERGETLTEFLDHAALVSDTDKYDPRFSRHADDVACRRGT